MNEDGIQLYVVCFFAADAVAATTCVPSPQILLIGTFFLSIYPLLFRIRIQFFAATHYYRPPKKKNHFVLPRVHDPRANAETHENSRQHHHNYHQHHHHNSLLVPPIQVIIIRLSRNHQKYISFYHYNINIIIIYAATTFTTVTRTNPGGERWKQNKRKRETSRQNLHPSNNTMYTTQQVKQWKDINLEC